MRLPRSITRVSSAAASEEGQGLIELLIAMIILATAVGALLSLMVASAVSIQRSDEKGTALTIAENQLELYRNVSYPNIRLSATTLAGVPAASAYMTAHTSDGTIPSGASGSQVLDTTTGNNACSGTDLTTLCAPVQNVVGPDGRAYEVDTYITQCPNAAITSCPSSGDPVKQVFVVVRDHATSSTRILARNASTFTSLTTATS